MCFVCRIGFSAELVAFYEFEQDTWSNSASVLDSTANSKHGSPLGSIAPYFDNLEQKSCSALTVGFNNSNSEINAVDTGVNINDLGNNGTISFWYKSNEDWSGGGDRQLLDASLGSPDNKYFFLVLRSNGSLRFGLEYNGDDDLYSTTETYAFAADEWVHIAVTWDPINAALQLYINGQKASTTDYIETPGGSTLDGMGTLFIGDNRSTYAVNGSSANSANGSFDDVRIYNFVQDKTAIDSDMQDVSICIKDLLAEYRFEEDYWDGTVDEVLDSSGNDYHGVVTNNSTAKFSSPALPGKLGTCGYASQNDGSIQVTGLPLDTITDGSKTTVTFWMNWDGTESSMPIGWNGHDIWIVGGSIGFNTGSSDVYGISSAGLANTWHHFTVEFTNGSVTDNRIYLDGVEQTLTQRQGTPNLSQAYVDNTLRIGGWSNDRNYDFHGLIDEVRVYESDLTTTQIELIMNERHACPTKPIAEYRFDELLYNDLDDVVVDSVGGANGQALSATVVEGKVCNAVDLTATGIEDYLILDENVLTGQTDFTLSVWAKTDKQSHQSILSGAGAKNNELIMWFLDNDSFRPHLKDENNGDVSIAPIDDDNWHHLVWTREGDQSCIYQDKIFRGCVTQLTGTLDIQSLIVGQEQDSIGGGFDASQAFDGLLDEFMVYNQAMNQSEITALYDNQAAGLNADGSARVCPAPASLLVEYRFEESSWDGTADEILDYSGNDFHAQVNHNSVPATATPALVGKLGTCGYASQNDGAIQVTGLPLDTLTDGVKTSVTFWMNWDGTNSVMPVGWRSHDIWMVGGSMGFNTGTGDLYGISSADLANGWHHVVVEFTNGSVTNNRIYIDGIEQVLTQRQGTPTKSRTYIDSEFRIGGWAANAGYDFHGLIDEVRIYQGVLTTTDVHTIMDERHSCPVPDHYEIQHNGQGLTCEAESMTIKACANESCDTLYSNETTINLSPLGWSQDSLVFTGQMTTSLSVTNASTITMEKTSANPDAPLRCFNGGTETCEIEFVDSAFVFFGNTEGDLLPDQLAETNFLNVNLRAVEKDTSTGSCKVALIGTTNITLGYDCINPTEDKCITPFSGIAIAGDGTGESTGVYPLTFDSNGHAELTGLSYADAGRLQLSAESSAGGSILKGSATVDVYPSYLKLSITDGALLYTGAGDTDLYRAGLGFSYTIGAYGENDNLLPNYQAENLALKVIRDYPIVADTVDGNFKYKDGGTVTSATGSPSFYSVSGVGFTDGKYTYETAYYSETGRITLDVEDSDYLANTIASESSLSLGTFIPAYYSVSEEAGASAPALQNTHVNVSSSNFTYLGQAISFSKESTLLITPKNALDQVTKNYIYGGWNYAPTLTDLKTAAKLSFTDTSSYVGSSQVVHQNAPIMTTVAAEFAQRIELFDTQVTYNKVDSSNLMYGPVDPFDAKLNINFLAPFFTDENGICYRQNYADSSCDGYYFNDVEGANLRFGRLALHSNYGPETEALQVPLIAEYYQGGKWLTNIDDNQTAINFDEATGHLILKPLGSVDLTDDLNNISSDGILLLGEADKIGDLIFNGPNSQGEVLLQLNTLLAPTTWPEYLNYDWNGDKVICNLATCPDGPDSGSAADETDYPNATISFGLFRGNDRIIQWREVFN
ncbi:LamG domain-containing protein [Paraglaciecola sp. L3A3]|uniref:LamG domain-containing protein n=1 Tax=Paraglaciecola sp. L3A3 TaxID=2686358 RepID=UPI00131A8ED5|nr:LamG domain-containing protein [Paraglaciecola sp. L3A3]